MLSNNQSENIAMRSISIAIKGKGLSIDKTARLRPVERLFRL